MRKLFLILALTLSLGLQAKNNRTIKQVASISVETPAGTVPRLPWQVWVTYSDGTH